MVKAPLLPNASTKRYHQTQALMGATRPALSGIKAKAHTPNKGSQTALITRLLVSLCLKNPDNAGRVAPIRGSV